MSSLNHLGLSDTDRKRVEAALAASADPDGALDRLGPLLTADPDMAGGDHLPTAVALAASSRALASHLVSDPGLLTDDEGSAGRRLRAALVQIAGADLAGAMDFREATFTYSSRIDRIVQDALEGVTDSLLDAHPVLDEMPFAVIAMGKWGAQELNYYSDIDVLFTHEPIVGRDTESRDAARALASRLIAVLSTPSFDGSPLQVDAGLRPEGAAGPLTRSLEGYRTYYDKWGEPWELQALLKARAGAGDPEIGSRFESMAGAIVWDRGLDVDALRSVRQIKAQVEERASPLDLKRARGGIRDIEFTVQLLQLVHGRFDTDLRVRATLDAIAVLGEHGYVTTEEADRLMEAYTFLRDVEHRVQLWDLEQTHLLPEGDAARARIGRGLGFTGDPAATLTTRLDEVRSEVRGLHEHLYFRPILDSLAGVPSARLNPSDATLRLEALGFRDTVGAVTAFTEMTSGLSRRSRVMHQVLPLTLDWLSLSPDPDLGLAQLRLLLAHTSDHSALVTLLQNNPLAGERLCLLLGTGKLLGELIDRIPEFVPRLSDDSLLADIRDLDGAKARLNGLLESRPDPEAKVGTIRRFVRRRKLRVAARDVLGSAPTEATLLALADTADAAVEGAVHMATDGSHDGFGVVAMGKWGGREMSYGSDIDLIYVRADTADPDGTQAWAASLSRILSEPNRHGEAYEIDTGLRPEGRAGPLVRSLEGYRRYYAEWAEAWEMLALVKARPAVGDDRVLGAFGDLLEPVIWSENLPAEIERDIRAIKARVESERIPPGEDPDFHLKLGPGSLSDVEFLCQLLQLRHGGALPGLRVTNTLEALRRLREEAVLKPADFNALRDSYLFCTRVRLRLHLQRGLASDSLPTDPEASSRLAISLGFDRTSELREHYRRHTRRARRTFETLFYE